MGIHGTNILGTDVYKTFVQCYTVDVVRGMASCFADWRLSGVVLKADVYKNKRGIMT